MLLNLYNFELSIFYINKQLINDIELGLSIYIFYKTSYLTLVYFINI